MDKEAIKRELDQKVSWLYANRRYGKKDKNEQKRYEAVIVTLIMLIIIGAPILWVLVADWLGAIVIIVSIILIIILGKWRGKKALKVFYKIKNGQDNFEIIKVEDYKQLEEMNKESYLVFFLKTEEQILNFIYNWLNNKKMIKEKKINIYEIGGNILNNHFEFISFNNDYTFLAIRTDDLDFNSDNLEQFTMEQYVMNASWLEDVMKKFNAQNDLYKDEE